MHASPTIPASLPSTVAESEHSVPSSEPKDVVQKHREIQSTAVRETMRPQGYGKGVQTAISGRLIYCKNVKYWRICVVARTD